MRFKLSAGASVLTLGLVLSGCGGDPEEEAQTASSLCAPVSPSEDDGDAVSKSSDDPLHPTAENCLDVIERDDSIVD